MKPHYFLPEAEAELRDTFDFYESRSGGLGVRFLVEVEATVTRICEAPLSFSPVAGPVRRARVFSFPHFVYFEDHGKVIAILSVFHFRRRPKPVVPNGHA